MKCVFIFIFILIHMDKVYVNPHVTVASTLNKHSIETHFINIFMELNTHTHIPNKM